MSRAGAGLLIGAMIGVFLWITSPVLVSVQYGRSDSKTQQSFVLAYRVLGLVLGAIVFVAITVSAAT